MDTRVIFRSNDEEVVFLNKIEMGLFGVEEPVFETLKFEDSGLSEDEWCDKYSLKQYRVTYQVSGTVTVLVDAYNEEDAYEQAETQKYIMKDEADLEFDGEPDIEEDDY